MPLVGGLAALAVPLTEAPAHASSTYLCTGYTGCADAGYSDAGYGAHNRTMYWRMYDGHNCTNYVAYRMIQAGMSKDRPWSGPGNASYWGHYMSKITDQTPRVGAVAWFERGLAGGSAGHVAYVEKVISPTDIVISEDSWNGDFHWAELTKDGGTWPSGFIHFVDRTEMKNTIKPHISGTPQVNKPLALARGGWKPAGATFSYQWFANGVPVPGATGVRFSPGPLLAGKHISAKVTAKKDGAITSTVQTERTGRVVRGVLTTTAAPVLTGDGLLGAWLHAKPATWSKQPDTVFYRWRADGEIVPGAHGTVFVLSPQFEGKTITVEEVVRKKGYQMTYKASNPVGPVAERTLTVDQPFQATGDGLHLGQTLAITPGTVSPSTVRIAYSWFRDGVQVPGVTSPSYDLTADDLGHSITAQVTISKPNYTTLVRNFEFGGPVTSEPVMDLTTRTRARAAGVSVKLNAPGVGPVTGNVRIAVNGQHAVVHLVDGRGHVFVKGLKPGKRHVTATYVGTDRVAPVTKQAPVQVVRWPHESVKHHTPKHEPVKHHTVKHEPVKHEQAKHQPVKHEEPKSKPAKDDGAKAKHQPSKHEPAKDQPAKHQPAKHDGKVKHQPAKHDGKAKHQPAKHDGKAKETKAKDSKAKDAQAKDAKPKQGAKHDKRPGQKHQAGKHHADKRHGHQDGREKAHAQHGDKKRK